MESSEFNSLTTSKGMKFKSEQSFELNFSIINLTVDKAVKNWSFESSYPDCLALFSNDEINSENLIKALMGSVPIMQGKILIDKKEVTYNAIGFERKMAYVDLQLQSWNKLFSIQYNLARTAMRNKPFLQDISNHNQKIKTDIENLKDTGLNLDCGYFKEKLINIIKRFIRETQSTRTNFIKEYEFQIIHFHKNFVQEKFNFSGCETLSDILIKKFTAEEENIIANNNLLFLQSLQDRIASLENLTGECFCGCSPPKERRSQFQLREIIFVVKEINSYLNKKVTNTRSEIRTTLKTCNNHNQNFNNELNRLLSYKQISFTRAQIDQILEQWIDLAEVQRIKFNMKQDFVAMQLLPDEMHLLLKNIKDEIKIYHDKILKHPELEEKETYQNHLKLLYNSLIDARDLISKNIFMLFKELELNHLLTMRITQLTVLERQIIKILQQLIVPTKILILHIPFELLNYDDKEKLAIWIKKIQKFLKIIIIFTTNTQFDINLLATSVTVIENEIIIQQGKIGDVTDKPLSLNLLKEINKQRINTSKGIWNTPNLFFYNVNLGKFTTDNTPTIAFKSNDVLFSRKKPKFAFLKSAIVIKGVIKGITKINEKTSYLIFETFTREEFEVLSSSENIAIGVTGWISITKNSIFVFDGKNQQLIGTW
ncbi:hypothetical protein [Spiroplasma endosymbiont of Virgichneumon dumeticola]|uniref:hypothetical protein n=1 Tax=Spiroplasma endosymbiont of Virgichneumon dumeticola TaxID=3139323 RepID=UPI0035C93E71